ncbi:cardiolipin synthase [Ascidiimonas aurantiaca]|uniref:cardiolipin synthase n=1 Tax=Ascidiimonas aurantiaca TaxID=1685432 RepID=UPI0030ED5E5A
MNIGLLTLYLLFTVWAVFSVIMYGSRPTKSLGWILTIFIFPFGGPILYYLFGVNRRKFKLFRRNRYLNRVNLDQKETYTKTEELTDFGDHINFRSLAFLLKNAAKEYPTAGNDITVLHNGAETFKALFSSMEKAEKFIHLQYYIFEKGKLQDKLYELFQKKIQEGVEIRLIYDSFGSFFFRGKRKQRFLDLGVELHPIMPIRFGNFLFSLNYRNHRKIVIIDGVLGFTGGINISDKYVSNKDELGRWRDVHVRLAGPSVNRLHQVFLRDYYHSSKGQSLFTDEYLPKQEKSGEAIVQIVSSGPDSKFPSVMMQYVAMINQAQNEICICNPYFIPGETVLHAVKMAALKGIKVKLLVPQKSDSILAKYGMYSNFEDLLEAGVDIYLRKDFTHSKLIIIDKDLVSVGSGNFDFRSFEHNFETNALLFHKKTAHEVLKDFDQHVANAKKLSYDTFKRRPGYKKFFEGVAKFFAPLL